MRSDYTGAILTFWPLALAYGILKFNYIIPIFFIFLFKIKWSEIDKCFLSSEKRPKILFYSQASTDDDDISE